MAVHGELGTFVKGRFDTLVIAEKKYFYAETSSFGSKVRGKPHLWTDDADIALEFVSGGAVSR